MRLLFILLLGSLPALALAAAEPPSVDDNIHAMDTNRDGMVTVTEMRAYLEAKYGKNYQQAVLEEMEVKAGLKSCASPFSKSLY
jgi:hypothetical protein